METNERVRLLRRRVGDRETAAILGIAPSEVAAARRDASYSPPLPGDALAVCYGTGFAAPSGQANVEIQPSGLDDYSPVTGNFSFEGSRLKIQAPGLYEARFSGVVNNGGYRIYVEPTPDSSWFDTAYHMTQGQTLVQQSFLGISGPTVLMLRLDGNAGVTLDGLRLTVRRLGLFESRYIANEA